MAGRVVDVLGLGATWRFARRPDRCCVDVIVTVVDAFRL